jgi:hypothetical protein
MMPRGLRNALMVTAACLPLSGCLLPPAVSLASLVLDVGSFAVSGKTMTDHGLSVVVQEDCALLRVFDGEVCEPYYDFEEDVSLAALEPMVSDNEDDFSQLAFADDENPLSGLDYAVAGTAVDPGSTSDAFVARPSPVQLAAVPGQNDGPIVGLEIEHRGYLADSPGVTP